jgi:mRNA interferase MazF
VRVRPTEAGLPKESVANVSQVLTVDKDVLTARAGQLRPATLEQVAAGLRLALDL